MRNNKGQFVKGYVPPTAIKKGEHRGLKTQFKKGSKLSESTKQKMRGRVSPMKGKKHKIESNKKNSLKHLSKRGYWTGKPNLKLRGKNNPNWKGGLTKENLKIRSRVEFRLWREAVFSRDNWICQKCKTRGGILHPHHILNFAEWKELRFAIDNGITFCKICHNNFHKIYSRKHNTREQLLEFLL